MSPCVLSRRPSHGCVIQRKKRCCRNTGRVECPPLANIASFPCRDESGALSGGVTVSCSSSGLWETDPEAVAWGGALESLPVPGWQWKEETSAFPEKQGPWPVHCGTINLHLDTNSPGISRLSDLTANWLHAQAQIHFPGTGYISFLTECPWEAIIS